MNKKYTAIMEDGVNDKRILLQFINWNNPIFDVGGSTGVLTFELASHRGHPIVISVEPDKETFEVLQRNTETFNNVKVVNDTIQKILEPKRDMPINVVLSSVVHHMIKHRGEAYALLTRLFSDLPSGSRVLIRDGVRPSSHRESERIGLVCNPMSLNLAKEFFKRFGEWKFSKNMMNFNMRYKIDGCTVWAERWLLVEMLLTITWGAESMIRECCEHYTILGLNDYLNIFKSMDYNVLYAEAIIQPGYYEYLPKLGKLINDHGYEIPWPFTNQILAFEKQ